MPVRQPKIKSLFTTEEIKSLMKKSDWKAAGEVLYTWALIVGALAACAAYPHPLVIVAALFILGGRQLALGILMHDTAHHAFFTNKKVDAFVGRWLAAFPLLNSWSRYRPYHLQHHGHTGTEKDPDLPITRVYPTSKKGLFRKLMRDFTLMSGLKNYIGIFMMHFGFLKYSLGGSAKKEDRSQRNGWQWFKFAVREAWGPVVSHLILFGICFAVGYWWLYLIWLGAMMTTAMFSFRVRAMAEHSVISVNERHKYPTRTVKANFLETLLFAPHHVNYHLEHHLIMTVPSYNLPKMHRVLLERGFYDEHAVLETGYLNILKRVANQKLQPTPLQTR